MSEELKGVATLDTKPLERGSAKAVEAYRKIGREAKVTDASLTKASGGADQAAFALTNLGRVAQDAPFGFIGIQNNINPLLESFQRLKASTGTTGGALKALAGSLAGPAGLGLAISVVSSAITVLSMNGFFRSAKAADAAADAANKYKDAVKGIFDASAQEASQTAGLIAILKSENETRKRKLEGLAELKKINPEIFGQLKLEGTLVQGLDAAYKEYLSNFKVVIAAKVTQLKLEQQITRLLELQGTTQTQQQKNLNKAFDDINKARTNSLKELSSEGAQAANVIQGLTDNINAAKSTEIAKVNSEIDFLIKQLAEFSKGIETKEIKEGAEKTKKELRSIADVLADLDKQIRFLEQRELVFFDNEAVNRVNAVKGAIDELVRDFGKTSDSKLIQGLLDRITLLRTRIDEVPKVVQQVNQDPQLVIRPRIEPFIGAPELLKQVIDVTEQINQIVTDTMVNAATALGEGLANLFNGNSSIGDFFKGIFEQIGEGLQSLGKYLIQTALIIKVIRSALVSNPALAVAAGIGLVALGGIIKNAVAKRDAFAGGVRNYGGGVALVGERGPELLQLPRGSSVVPNAQTSNMVGQAQVFIANTVIRGQDLVLSYSRANSSLGRTT